MLFLMTDPPQTLCNPHTFTGTEYYLSQVIPKLNPALQIASQIQFITAGVLENNQ